MRGDCTSFLTRVICPGSRDKILALQWLEEAGYVTSAPQDGKKVYTITEEGKKYLAEKADERVAFKEQVRDRWGDWSQERRDEMNDVWYE